MLRIEEQPRTVTPLWPIVLPLLSQHPLSVTQIVTLPMPGMEALVAHKADPPTNLDVSASPHRPGIRAGLRITITPRDPAMCLQVVSELTHHSLSAHFIAGSLNRLTCPQLSPSSPLKPNGAPLLRLNVIPPLKPSTALLLKPSAALLTQTQPGTLSQTQPSVVPGTRPDASPEPSL
jgi:hypothetical protein